MMRVFKASAVGIQKAVAKARFAIVVSEYNRTVTEGLLEGAIQTLKDHGVGEEAVDVFWVPGSFEIPTVAGHLARGGRYAAVLCLGAVIKGETTHDQHINRAVSLSLAQLGVETGVPVLFGVLTCNTLEQALARSGKVVGTRGKDVAEARTGNKGVECAEAALEMVALLQQMAEEGLAKISASIKLPNGQWGVSSHPTGEGESSWRFGPSESQPTAGGVSGFGITMKDPLKAGESSHSSPSPSAVGGMAPAAVASAAQGPGDKAPGALPASEEAPPRQATPRVRAREAAFQILFHWDINPQFPWGEVDRFLRANVGDANAVAFAQELIRGVTELHHRLDEEIQSVSENWTVSRMSTTDRTILRLGTYELLYTETPGEVIIDQAVELAKRFGTTQSGAFVNGILDRLMHKIRGGEETFLRQEKSSRQARGSHAPQS